MTMPLKIVEMDGAAVVVLPREMLATLKATIGNTVHLSETATGIELTGRDPDMGHKLAVAERIMREDRYILHVLAQ